MKRPWFALAMITSLLQACAGRSGQDSVGSQPASRSAPRGAIEDFTLELENVGGANSCYMFTDGRMMEVYDFPGKKTIITIERRSNDPSFQTTVSIDVDGRVKYLTDAMPWKEAIGEAFKAAGYATSWHGAETLRVSNPK